MWAAVTAAAIFEPGRGNFRVRRPAPARWGFHGPGSLGLPGRLDPEGASVSSAFGLYLPGFPDESSNSVPSCKSAGALLETRPKISSHIPK